MLLQQVLPAQLAPGPYTYILNSRDAVFFLKIMETNAWCQSRPLFKWNNSQRVLGSNTESRWDFRLCSGSECSLEKVTPLELAHLLQKDDHDIVYIHRSPAFVMVENTTHPGYYDWGWSACSLEPTTYSYINMKFLSRKVCVFWNISFTGNYWGI